MLPTLAAVGKPDAPMATGAVASYVTERAGDAVLVVPFCVCVATMSNQHIAHMLIMDESSTNVSSQSSSDYSLCYR